MLKADWLNSTGCRRVKFLIAGAQKSGTTALSDYLRAHKNIFIPEQKELHFFDDESVHWKNSSAPRPALRRYHDNFRKATESTICGEATPIYMYWDSCAKRIWRYNPMMKIVVILRNPIDRAYSHWSMEWNRGNEKSSFSTALEQEEARCRAERPLQHRIYSYVDRGLYCNQILRLWRYFGKEAVLVLKQEDLIRRPQETIRATCQHIGASSLTVNEPLLSFAGTYAAAMDSESRTKLQEVYRREIHRLEAMLGWDCKEWFKA